LLAPAGTPATIVHKLHLETVKVLAQPDLRAKFADLGLEVIGTSPDEFAAVIKSEIPRWAKLIKEFLFNQGLDAAPGTPEEFAAYIKSETAKWAKVIKAAGIKVE